MKTNLFTLLFLLILLAGCQSEPKDFSLSFSIETVNNYKVAIGIDNDHNYAIEEQNLFLDKNQNRENIKQYKGTLTDDELAILKKLLAHGRLFSMKDSYGFDKEPDSGDPLKNVLYQLTYTADGKDKAITIRPTQSATFPAPFLSLIEYLNTFISAHRK